MNIWSAVIFVPYLILYLCPPVRKLYSMILKIVYQFTFKTKFRDLIIKLLHEYQEVINIHPWVAVVIGYLFALLFPFIYIGMGLLKGNPLAVLTLDEGILINSAVAILHYRPEFSDKYFWYEFFTKNQINHPKMVALNKKGKFVDYGMVPGTKYIYKPLKGTQGRGIGLITLEEISDLDMSKDFLIQERVDNCGSDKPRHFRAITLYDGTVFQITQYQNKNGGVVSNSHAGGHVSYCGKNCKWIPREQMKAIRKVSRKLAKAHLDNFPKIFSIGWDVMVDCSDGVQAYVLEGNKFHSGTTRPDWPNQMDRIKKCSQAFVKY